MNAKFGIAVKCVVFFDKKALLLSKTQNEMKDDYLNSCWDLPGGRVNYKESSDSALLREVYEETGLQIEDICVISTSTIVRKDGLHLLILLYRANAKSNNVTLSEEHHAYKWIDSNTLEKNSFSLPKWIVDSIDTALKFV